MIAVLLILIPVVAGIAAMFIGNDKNAKIFSLLASCATLALALAGVYATDASQIHYSAVWLPDFGSHFSVTMDGMAKMLCLLNAIALPIIISSSYNSNYKNAGSFYGLLMLMQAGIMGVFLASDLLLFYFAWEVALIPA